ncbi:MAG: oligosaccharide flippase family protein [Lewinellaceae bacterium]|nr:oligosaccharide flippase family protein [Lewinellaceae bacterium]
MVKESLSSQAGKSAVLLGSRKIWGGLLSLVVMAYLARILDASDFGLVAIATTLVGFVQAISSGGIGEFIVYYNKEDKEDIQQLLLDACDYRIVGFLLFAAARYLGNFIPGGSARQYHLAVTF